MRSLGAWLSRSQRGGTHDPAPPPCGYAAQVRAVGPVCGSGRNVGYVLGTFRSISPVLVLRWLNGEALRLADRLDPDPVRTPRLRPGLREQAAHVPDCPAELRTWTADLGVRREIRARLRAGWPVSVAFEDGDCTYLFSVRPVGQHVGQAAELVQEPVVQRIGGLAHPLYARGEAAPWR
ncbi:hypothetical protein [Streptomyces phytohabitans]|uniref:hypothetical protein n=1 Tax=Streptomyces phytohabitans TaxID=1150371 RepID=UPI00345C4377